MTDGVENNNTMPEMSNSASESQPSLRSHFRMFWRLKFSQVKTFDAGRNACLPC